MSAKPDTISLAPERSLNQRLFDTSIGSFQDTEIFIDGSFSIPIASFGKIGSAANTPKYPQRKKERRREMRKMWRLIGYIV